MKTTVIVIIVILAAASLTWIMINGFEDGDDPNTITTPSGLKYVDLVVGTGREAKTGDTVKVHYTGRFKDGSKFDSSVDRNDPFVFQLGAREVIKGWDEGIAGMKEGGKRKLVVPSELAYGRSGRDGIPPNSQLTFEVELLRIQ